MRLESAMAACPIVSTGIVRGSVIELAAPVLRQEIRPALGRAKCLTPDDRPISGTCVNCSLQQERSNRLYQCRVGGTSVERLGAGTPQRFNVSALRIKNPTVDRPS